jgi:hypothetical protein
MAYSVVGLDQAMRRTGWAHYYQGAARPTFGLYELPYWGDNEGDHALAWFEWLLNFCTERKATHLFYENTDGQNFIGLQERRFEPRCERLASNSLMVLPGMVGAKLKITHYMLDPAKWRGRFLGCSTAPNFIKDKKQRRAWLKAEAKKAAARLDWFVDDDNVAEALGVMHYGVCTIDPLYASRTDPIFRRMEAYQDDRRRREG